MAIMKVVCSLIGSQWSALSSNPVCSCLLLKKATFTAWFWTFTPFTSDLLMSMSKELQQSNWLRTKEHISWAVAFVIGRWQIELILLSSRYAEWLVWSICFTTEQHQCRPQDFLTWPLKETSWLPTLKWLSYDKLTLLWDPTKRASVLSLFSFSLLPVIHLLTVNTLFNISNQWMKVRWSWR